MMLRIYLLVFVAPMIAIGCGPSGAPHEKSVNVSGIASYQGKPLPGYTVTFVPSDGRRPAVGVTDDQGLFTLGTNEPGDGAPPGSCKVGVTWAGPPGSEPGGEVIVDDPNKSPKPPVELPAKYADPEQSGLTVEVPEDGLEGYAIDLK